MSGRDLREARGVTNKEATPCNHATILPLVAFPGEGQKALQLWLSRGPARDYSNLALPNLAPTAPLSWTSAVLTYKPAMLGCSQGSSGCNHRQREGAEEACRPPPPRTGAAAILCSSCILMCTRKGPILKHSSSVTILLLKRFLKPNP